MTPVNTTTHPRSATDLETALRTQPGPTAPTRPTTPWQIWLQLVHPVLTAVGWEEWHDRDAWEWTVVYTEEACTVTVTCLSPARWQHIRTARGDSTHLWNPQAGEFGIITDGYRWAVARTTTESAERLADMNLTASWHRLRQREESMGYMTAVIHRVSRQQIRELLSPSRLGQWC